MFTKEEIIKATNAQLFGCPGVISGVSTDSRKIEKGDLFVALRGDIFDGHNFVETAYEKGAAAILGERRMEVNLPQFIVRNSLTAYQQLANFNRRKINVPVIGITGTNGKTTVKEMIDAILKSVGNPLTSEANFNNHIGVPMTLLKLKKEHTHAVIEMGMNHLGEIKVLSEIAQPDAAVITSIGRGHLEFLGSVENVMKAKLEILDGMKKNSTIALPAESKFFNEMKRAADNFKILSFGDNGKADVNFIVENFNENGCAGFLTYKKKSVKTNINLIGKHNCRNAAAAAAAVIALNENIPLENIAAGLSNLKSVNLRCQITEENGVKFILDCYNANPDSTRAAVELLSSIESSGKKIAALGDMLELGEKSARFHFEIGKFAAEKNTDVIITAGVFAKYIADGALDAGMTKENIIISKSVDDAAMILKKKIQKGDVVLIKASRRAHFEKLLTNTADMESAATINPPLADLRQ